MQTLRSMADDLARLATMDRRRALTLPHGRDFSSNDYLGLASAERLRSAVVEAIARDVAVGAGGSRLLRGNTDEHVALEEDAARFFGADAALFVSSGYAANAMLFATLPQRGDLVVYDSLIHASAHEGMRLGRAETIAFAHNDLNAAKEVIAGWRRRGGTGTPWIAIESLYSMDGDCAPIADCLALADRMGAMLLIDEAHATGVFGPDGRGLAAAASNLDHVVTLRTCGKALGCEGALVLGSQLIRDVLVNRGRAFIFSTAPSPLMAAAVRESLRILRDEPERRERLAGLMTHAAKRLRRLGLAVSGSPIQPIILGDDTRTMACAARLGEAGFDVRGIRPPTVPVGTSRLRVSITLNVDEAAIDALADTLETLL